MKSKPIYLTCILILSIALNAIAVSSQDEPEVGPLLCDPETVDEYLIPLAEFEINPVDDDEYSFLVEYTNELGQTFNIIITAINQTDESLEALQTYITEARLCVESGDQPEELARPPLDIPFGTIFLEYLGEFVNLEELIDLIIELQTTEEIFTLADLIPVDLEEIVNLALEQAYIEIDSAVEEGELTEEEADLVREEITAMYFDSLEAEGAPIIISEQLIRTGIIIDIMSPDPYEGEIIYLLLDPGISKNHWHIYLSSNSDGTTYASVCASGRVGVYLWTTSNYWWGRKATSNQCVNSTVQIQGSELQLKGFDSMNDYTIQNSGWN